MDPMRRDVRAAMTGRAHSDAYPDDREAGRRNGVTRRTACRWSHEGPPQARSFQRYLFNAPNPYPILADTQAAVKARFKSGQTTEELIRDFHALRAQEKAVEGEDNGVDCSRGPTMLDRALMKQRDAAINLELAAILRLLAERRVTEDDLMAGVG